MVRTIVAALVFACAATSAHADCFPKFGTDGDDVLAANPECSRGQILIGLGGDDVLTGGAGDDVLWGDACSADRGGGFCRPGGDVMTGGSGDDAFAFNIANESRGDHVDEITDFTHGDDAIAMAGVCFHASATCSFIGVAAFDGAPGEVRYRVVHQPGGATTTVIDADLDGDRATDFEVDLTGAFDLTAGDFLFDTYPPL